MVKSSSLTIVVTAVGVSGIPNSFANVTVSPSTTVPLGTAMSISGTLLDGVGAPIAGWTVQLRLLGGGPSPLLLASAVTDASGNFTMSYTPTARGTSTVIVMAVHYAQTVNYQFTITVT